MTFSTELARNPYYILELKLKTSLSLLRDRINDTRNIAKNEHLKINERITAEINELKKKGKYDEYDIQYIHNMYDPPNEEIDFKENESLKALVVDLYRIFETTINELISLINPPTKRNLSHYKNKLTKGASYLDAIDLFFKNELKIDLETNKLTQINELRQLRNNQTHNELDISSDILYPLLDNGINHVTDFLVKITKDVGSFLKF